MKSIVCIYHKDCIDGTTAAAVVLRKFPEAHCFPVGHTNPGEELTTLFENIPADAHIYIVDTTHGLTEARKRGHTVTVLDHHISEYEKVKAFSDSDTETEYVFDITKCGSSLAWSYFFPNEPLPTLIAHVEDIDLWRKDMGDETDYVANYLAILRNDPQTICTLLSASIETIYERGALLTQNARMEIERFLSFSPLSLMVGPLTVPAFNITNYQSDCGNILATRLGCAVALYTIRGDIVRFSIRSLDAHTPSALDIALILGGGGHRNASGATMPIRDFITNLIL